MLLNIILIQNQPVFTLTPKWCVLSEEAANINFIIFGLTQPRFEPTIYSTWDEHANHYINDAVCVEFNGIIHAHVYYKTTLL